jgi:hypothetical protein
MSQTPSDINVQAVNDDDDDELDEDLDEDIDDDDDLEEDVSTDGSDSPGSLKEFIAPDDEVDAVSSPGADTDEDDAVSSVASEVEVEVEGTGKRIKLVKPRADEVDPSLIVTGRRQRRPPNRYVPENLEELMLHDVPPEELHHALGLRPNEDALAQAPADAVFIACNSDGGDDARGDQDDEDDEDDSTASADSDDEEYTSFSESEDDDDDDDDDDEDDEDDDDGDCAMKK